jgi:plasmid maintenance system antidote protein VapI
VFNISRYGFKFHKLCIAQPSNPGLAKVFGTCPDFWLNGQLVLDLYRASNDKKGIEWVEKIEPVLH